MSQSVASAWNPSVYGQRFVEERSRPGLELIQRAKYAESQSKLINPEFEVKVAYDLGCGTGRFVPSVLSQFESITQFIGTDSSDKMLQEADAFVKKSITNQSNSQSIKFINNNLEHFVAEPKADLLFSNAVIHWLPDHMNVLKRLMNQLNTGGILAIQIPNDFHKPSHTAMFDVLHAMERENKLETGFTDKLHSTAAAVDPSGLIGYYNTLRPLSSHLDVWETVYYHNASCPFNPEAPSHPVVHFLQGSSLGQISHAVPEQHRTEFLTRFTSEMNKAYPTRTERNADGSQELHCVFPFSRWFMVAVKKTD